MSRGRHFWPFVLAFLFLLSCATVALSPEQKRAEFSDVSKLVLLTAFRQVLQQEGYTPVRWVPATGELDATLESTSLSGEIAMFGIDANQNYPTGGQMKVRVRLRELPSHANEAAVTMTLTENFARRAPNQPSSANESSIEDPKPYARLFERVRTQLEPVRVVKPKQDLRN